MKLRLDQEEMLSDFFEETRLLGIVAPLEHYRFCWHVNNLLNFDFRINNQIEIQLSKKNRQYFFPVYQYGQSGGTIKHFIYNNQHDGEYLLPEFRHLDFLWLMKDDIMKDEEVNDFISVIKTLPVVQLVTELTNEKIKNKQHLVF